MSPGDSCRGRLRHRSWPVSNIGLPVNWIATDIFDEGWDSRRTLGCHSGRGYRATVQERGSDVRRLVPEVKMSGTPNDFGYRHQFGHIMLSYPCKVPGPIGVNTEVKCRHCDDTRQYLSMACFLAPALCFRLR